MDLHALQQLVLPSAVGTVAIVWSCISGVQTVGTIRYADKEFEHPYKPWLESHNDKEGRHYRGFKATMNCLEWCVYTVPLLWICNLYAPSLPYVGPYARPATGILAFAYAYFNKQYVPAYMESAKGRLSPFKARTNAFKLIALGAIAGVAFSSAKAFGFVA